ncbi:hypothetical protein [Plasticicumulans sp.]|uniref:hypothetical protein n=1 Tax=Plasticicumulans sp. TaxID=2307179 RepID=UPI00392F5844
MTGILAGCGDDFARGIPRAQRQQFASPDFFVERAGNFILPDAFQGARPWTFGNKRHDSLLSLLYQVAG